MWDRHARVHPYTFGNRRPLLGQCGAAHEQAEVSGIDELSPPEEGFDAAKYRAVLLCGPNGVGRWRWVLSGGPTLLVGVWVGRNYGTVVVWYPAGGQVWPVKCPHSSAVDCGVPPADA